MFRAAACVICILGPIYNLHTWSRAANKAITFS